MSANTPVKDSLKGRRLRGHQLKGVSLVELLIAMAIGLIIITAALSAYVSSSSASMASEAQSVMHEDAQAALVVISRQLKAAGNNPNQNNRVDDGTDPLTKVVTVSSRRNPVYGVPTYPTGSYVNSNFIIRGCDGLFGPARSTRMDDLVCNAGTGPFSPSSVAVSFEADAFNTTPTTSNEATDCLGNKLPVLTVTLPTLATGVTSSSAYSVAENRLYIAASPTGVPGLYCKGNGADGSGNPVDGQAMVDNVEDLQVTYGLASMTTAPSAISTASVAGYLRAEDVSKLSSTANDPSPWAKVLTARICVVIRSEKQVAISKVAARYTRCDGTTNTSPPDLRLRHAYSTTVVLRNRRR